MYNSNVIRGIILSRIYMNLNFKGINICCDFFSLSISFLFSIFYEDFDDLKTMFSKRKPKAKKITIYI